MLWNARNRIKLHRKCPKIACGWGSAPDPAGGAYDAPPDLPSRLGRGIPPHHSPPPRRLRRLDIAAAQTRAPPHCWNSPRSWGECMQHCSAIHRNLLVSFIYYKIKKIQNTASLLHSCFHPYVTSTRAYGQNCTRGRKYLLPPSLPQTWRNFRYIRCRTKR